VRKIVNFRKAAETISKTTAIDLSRIPPQRNLAKNRASFTDQLNSGSRAPFT
jgi:hypothetical protein